MVKEKQNLITGYRHFSTTIVASFSLFFILAVSICWGDADTIYRENSPSVVVVVAIDREGKSMSQGSGFIVSEDGAVITNYHVISKATEIVAKTGEKIRKVEGVLYVDPENDVAIIKLEGKEYRKAKMGNPAELRVGEKVYVMGSPRGLENTISEGILSGIREIDTKRKILQMTAAISPGSSGGPVFNARGEVVGIATLILAEAQNLNFAIPVNIATAGLTKKDPVSPREACQVDFNGTAACFNYQGLAYGFAGQHDRAADAFKRSLTIDSKKVETYLNLGVSYINQGKYQQAIEIFLQALKIKADQPEVLSKLGMIYGATGRHQEALDIIHKSISMKANNPENYYSLAITYNNMGRFGEAADAAKEAIRLEPDYAVAHSYLGIVYTNMNLRTEAIQEFKKAIRLDPDDSAAHFGLGKVYSSMGEKASALEEYKMLKQLNVELAEKLFDLIYK
jgi:tetratricopeptide (TPR) repeat protein